MNDLVYARRMLEDSWEQIETATTWESIHDLSKVINHWSSEVRRLKRQYDLI